MQILALKGQNVLLLTWLAVITAINAASLGLKPVKLGRSDFKDLECEEDAPADAPGYLPIWDNLLDMCSMTESLHAVNLKCYCRGFQMICGSSSLPAVERLLDYCFLHCNCGYKTYRSLTDPTVKLDTLIQNLSIKEKNQTPTKRPRPPAPQHHTCSGSCTSVNKGCAWAYTGDCSCHAPPIGVFFWFKGTCETRFIKPTAGVNGKRELSPSSRFDYRNKYKRQVMDPSNVNHSSNPTTSGSQSQTSLVDKSAYKNLPAPCNESYVSYACHDAVDGIVHEPHENWLGALLPENVTEMPPVPAHWLKIHGFEVSTANGGVEVDVMGRIMVRGETEDVDEGHVEIS